MKTLSLLIFLLVIVFSGNGFSQASPVLKNSPKSPTPDDFMVGEVKGKMVNKPAYLPKPQYPAKARQLGVEGIVRVQIKIDEEGNVTETSIISGPEELQAVSIETAQKTRFVAYRDSSKQFIKTEGVLTYTFEIQRASWSNIGYGLNMITILPVATVPLPTFAKAIEPEWTDERQALEKLKEIQTAQFANFQNPNGSNAIGAVGVASQNQASVTARWQVPIPQSPSNEQITLAQNLISALQTRLKNDKLNLWRFNLGLGLSKILRLYRNPFTQVDASKIIKDFSENAPAAVQPEILAKLNYLAVILQNKDSLDEINQALAIIFSDK
jgi:TonB family protein